MYASLRTPLVGAAKEDAVKETTSKTVTESIPDAFFLPFSRPAATDNGTDHNGKETRQIKYDKGKKERQREERV